MVATMGSKNVATILGTSKVRCADISRHEWEEIIKRALKSVNLKNLHGFKSVRDTALLLEINRSIPKTVDGTPGFTASLRKDTSVYLHCAFLDFPEVLRPTEGLVVYEERLVLNRKGQFFKLTFGWQYRDRDSTTSFLDSRFELASFKSERFKSSTVPWEQGFCHEPFLGPLILSYLSSAQVETNKRKLEELEAGIKTAAILKGMQNRLA